MFKKTKSKPFLEFQMFGKTHSAESKYKMSKPVSVYSAENNQFIMEFSTVKAAINHYKMGWDTLTKCAKTGSSHKGFYFYFKNFGKVCNPLNLSIALLNEKNGKVDTVKPRLRNAKPVSVYLVDNEKFIMELPSRLIAREVFKISHVRLNQCLKRGNSFNGFYFCKNGIF